VYSPRLGVHECKAATKLGVMPDENWRVDALCRSLDPELFATQRMFGMAKHMCVFHCPVRDECHEWAAQFTDWFGICVGGVVHPGMTTRGLSRLPVKPPDLSECHLCTPSAPVITPNVTPQHGTIRRYRWDKKNGEEPCELCTSVYQTKERSKSTARKREERRKAREAQEMSNNLAKVEL
jgi:Transcription factor WhiB